MREVELKLHASSVRKCGAFGASDKMQNISRRLIGVCICVLIVAGLTACGPSPEEVRQHAAKTATAASSSTKSVPVAHKIGDTAHVGYTSYAVWKVFYRDKLSNNQYLNQPPDATYLFVDLTVRNNDKAARTIAPFKLIDENGAEYETSSKAWSVEGGIGMLDSLNPGVSKRGYIVFDVPRGKHYKLEISGGYWSKDKALVDLALK